MKKLPLILLALFTLSFMSACTRQARPPMVSEVKTADAGYRVSVAPSSDSPANATSATKPEEGKAQAISAEITLKKSEILGKEFLYGADLQYSSLYDEDMDLYNQSMAIGHIPVYFKINGKELQLIEDAKRSYPSDVNHPDRLVSRYKILAETEEALTVSDADSSEFLTGAVVGSQKSPKDRWTRSLEFVKEGNLVLQETSLLLADGSVVEMMESVMPKEALAPSSSFEAIRMDPTDPTGGLEGKLSRYRLLSGETIRKGEEKFAFAQHFDIGDGKTIDWYVTSNIKDEHLPVVRDALLGWNRYFKNFAGIEREVVRFMGRLPEGVKLGDPRYNVINWDSRLVAGAAYESQASDPFTGKQSHSLIYMPVAWFQIGADYWANGKYSDKADESGAQGKSHDHGRAFRNRCMRDLKAVNEALRSGRMTQEAAEKFAIQLMKGTLFHEVGHALGLAHNFKGSLTFDRSKPDSLFSSSIMDYNDYEIERQVFNEDSAEGPVLEYDRQALSALYNGMKDVKSSDPVMSVCNDAEADTEEAGAVDPTCMRYDIEKDPTLSVETAIKRLSEESLSGDVSLTEALQNMQKAVLTSEAIAAVKTEDDLNGLMTRLVSDLTGVLRFYHLSGKASLASTVRSNLKSLRPFFADVIGDLSEAGMRTRALNGLKHALELKTLSSAVQKQILVLAETAAESLKASPFMQAQGSSADAIALNIKLGVFSFGKRFERDGRGGLPRLRASILSRLSHIEGLPFFFGQLDGTSLDVESEITGILARTAGDLSATLNERLYAARSLKSFSGRPGVDAMISILKSQVESELRSAKNHEEREAFLLMKRLLG